MEIKELWKYQDIMRGINQQLDRLATIKSMQENVNIVTPDNFKESDKSTGFVILECRRMLVLGYPQTEMVAAHNQLHSHIEKLISFYGGE